MHGSNAVARPEPALGFLDVPSPRKATTHARVSPRGGFSAPLSQRRLRQIAGELVDALEGAARQLEDEAERLWDAGHGGAARSFDDAARIACTRAARARHRLT